MLTGQIPPFPTREVGGVPFEVASLEEASHWLIEEAVPRRLAVNVRLANAYNVALAGKDEDYAELMRIHGVNFPDGTPVVWFMNRGSHDRQAGRVRGPSLFPKVLRDGVPLGIRHFLLGGTPETLDMLSRAIRREHPGSIISGQYSPPFGCITDEFIDECADAVQATTTDIVWIGLGTPKQDVVGTALAERLELTTVNVGAAFDFKAGTVREAPEWIQGSGFEWFYRLCQNPTRLWKRYLIGNLTFLRVAISSIRNSQGRRHNPVPNNDLGKGNPVI